MLLARKEERLSDREFDIVAGEFVTVSCVSDAEELVRSESVEDAVWLKVDEMFSFVNEVDEADIDKKLMLDNRLLEKVISPLSVIV